MSNETRPHHSKLSADIWLAAKTRLPDPAKRGVERRLRNNVAPMAECVPARVRRIERPAPLPLTDAELKTLARRALLQAGVRGFAGLTVDVQAKIATLSGRLPTELEQQLAVQAVRRVNGILRVDQEIAVEESVALSAQTARRRSLPGWRAIAALIRAWTN